MPSLAPEPRSGPPKLGILDRLEYRRQEKYRVRFRALADLEDETNRRIANLLLSGEGVRIDVFLMIPRRNKRIVVRILDWYGVKGTFDRARAVYSIEKAHGLPDPFDYHGYVMSRYDTYLRELDRRFGYDREGQDQDSRSSSRAF